MGIQTASQAFTNEGGGGFSFRNKIINGDMRIDQRSSGTITATNAWMVDRFYQSHAHDGAQSFQQSSDAPSGFVNSILYTTTTADASLSATQYSMLRYKVEGYTATDFAWGTSAAKTATLSFWVKSSVAGTFGGTIISAGNDRVYPYTYTINAVNTWEKKIVVIPGDTTGTYGTTNGIGFEIKWSFGAGSTYTAPATGAWQAGFAIHATGATQLINTLNATWQITGVQLEIGNQATEFERRPYGLELSLCQRYCWVITPVYYSRSPMFGSGSNTSIWYAVFPVTMRTTPSLITKNISSSTVEGYNYTSNASTGNYSSVAVSEGDPNRIQVDWTWASGISAGQVASWRWIGSPASYLGFSAEL